MRFRLDHIAISAATLAEGVAWTEERLATRLARGGQHPAMGTHNRLLSLGDDVYLEVIAIDPEATAPDHPRWFDLDRFSGPPRLTNWILATDDLDAALAGLPDGFGKPMSLQRGDLKWRMAVPETGVLPFDNCAPALIEWQQGRAQERLPGSPCGLSDLTITHPQAADLKRLLGDLGQVTFHNGPPSLSATLTTPSGPVTL